MSNERMCINAGGRGQIAGMVTPNANQQKTTRRHPAGLKFWSPLLFLSIWRRGAQSTFMVTVNLPKLAGYRAKQLTWLTAAVERMRANTSGFELGSCLS
jgi:hypothetical protein